ncbi:MAG: SAM-dependent methyltransferase, partial [Gammaproteobacteria bacterium HGW-Gammaproteobacteria-1]
HNAALNGLDTMIYRDLPWAHANHPLPLYDLIIGSDILYERGHADLLAVLVQRHGTADGEVLITDPGRGNSSAFTRKMAAQGYTVTEQRSALDDDDKPPYRGRLLSYRHA